MPGLARRTRLELAGAPSRSDVRPAYFSIVAGEKKFGLSLREAEERAEQERIAKNSAKNGWHNSTNSASNTCGPVANYYVKLQTFARFLSASVARSMKVRLISMPRTGSMAMLGTRRG